jgi:hypothetical protein
MKNSSISISSNDVMEKGNDASSVGTPVQEMKKAPSPPISFYETDDTKELNQIHLQGINGSQELCAVEAMELVTKETNPENDTTETNHEEEKEVVVVML